MRLTSDLHLLAAAVTLVAALGSPRALAAQGAPSQPPSRTQILSAARDVMQQARYCTLVTLGENGAPQARVMDPFAPDSDLVIWLATNGRSRKVEQLRRDPRVTLLYFDAATNGEVTVLGTATLVSDSAEKARHWKEDWASMYQDRNRGDDYVLIRVRPTRLEISSPSRGMVNDPRTWRPVMLDLP